MENSVPKPQLLLFGLQPIKPSGAVCTWLLFSLEVPYGFVEFAARLLHIGHGSILRLGDCGSCFLLGLMPLNVLPWPFLILTSAPGVTPGTSLKKYA